MPKKKKVKKTEPEKPVEEKVEEEKPYEPGKGRYYRMHPDRKIEPEA